MLMNADKNYIIKPYNSVFESESMVQEYIPYTKQKQGKNRNK